MKTVLLMAMLLVANVVSAQDGATRVLENRDTLKVTWDSVDVRGVDRDPFLLQVFHDGGSTDTMYLALENDTTGVNVLQLLAADNVLELWLTTSVDFIRMKKSAGSELASRRRVRSY